jgi:hypothetical protein
MSMTVRVPQSSACLVQAARCRAVGDGHGGAVDGGWRNKSPDPAGQAARLVIEQTAYL